MSGNPPPLPFEPPPLPQEPPPIPPEALAVAAVIGSVAGSQHPWQNVALLRGFDTETPKFAAGYMAPRVVCASTSEVVDGQIRGKFIQDAAAAREVFRYYLENGFVIVLANAAYDLAVMAQADETLLPLIFAALREGRIYDILPAQALDAIAAGHIGYMPNGAHLINPATGKQTTRYSLPLVALLTLGRSDVKDNDVWRESYALLEDVPRELWPPQAKQYPIDDSVNTLEIAVAQIFGQPGKHDWEPAKRAPGDTSFLDTYVCHHCFATHDDNTAGFRSDGPCARAPRIEPHRNLDNLIAQLEAAFSLHLGACHGLRTDPERVAKLEAEVEEKHRIAVERFQKKGWIRGDGTEDQAAVKRALAIAYGAKEPCKRCDGAGRLKPWKSIECRGEKVRGRYQGCGLKTPSTIGSCKTCSDSGSVEVLGNEVTCKNVFDEADVLQEVGCDGSGFDLSTIPLLPRTEKFGVGTDRDAKMESGDDDMSDYGEDEFEKSRSTYVPWLKGGIDQPLTFKPNVLVATGRCSYEGSPVHQMPRNGHERECIRARGAWCGYPTEMVLGSTDYEAGELCLSGGTRILTERGYRPIRELVGQRVRVASRFVGEADFTVSPAFHDAEVFSTGRKSTLRITTIDGRQIECTENHPLLVQHMRGERPHHNRGCDPSWKKTDFEWRLARDIRVGDSLVSGSTTISDAKPEIDSKFYALGHFLGDGWLTRNKERRGGTANVGVCAGGHEAGLLNGLIAVWEEITDEAEVYAPSARSYPARERIELRHVKSHFSDEVSSETVAASQGVVELRVRRHVAVARLLQERYGFTSANAPQKRLPSCYWNATPDQKRSFLRGLFDADGSVVLTPRRSVSFTAANAELARDVLVALSEFGIDARMTTYHIALRDRSQTILQIRGNDNFDKVAKHILFLDDRFRSVKAERLSAVMPKQVQAHRHGMAVKAIEPGTNQEVFNLEVPTTRHYVAEGLVVHNCTLAQFNYWLFGYSRMRDVINQTGKPGILHSDLAAEVLGISLDEFLARLKAKDKTCVDFRQAMKPINFGRGGGMGTPKMVLTNRKRNAGFTKCLGGPARDVNGNEGYWGIRFCILVGGATACGTHKLMEWKRYPCAPVCRQCCEVVENLLNPAYDRRYPEMKDYFKWGGKKVENHQPAPSVVWDAATQSVKLTRVRGGCEYSAFLNNGFQSMLGDIMKAAFVDATRECYLGVKPDGSSSPLAGCRLPLAVHDEPVSELFLETAHISGPRIAEIMVTAGYRFAPDVTWKAETALAFFLSKKMEPVYVNGKLVPWAPEERKAA